MNRKRITALIVLMAIILSACSTEAPTEAPIPTGDESLIIPITGATEVEAEEALTPTDPPEPTPTPEPRPTNAPDCTNSASFVTDVTIPDNTEMVGGTAFSKTWRLVNTGTCIWASDYALTHYAEERFSAPASVPLALTNPGETLDISVPLVVPNTVGTHKSYFVIKNPAGLIMKIQSDSRLWVIVNVKTLSAATAPPATETASDPAVARESFAPVTCAYILDPARVNAVVDAVNAYRAESGLHLYTVNAHLALAAQAHANDMACNNLFVHTGSDGSTPVTRVAASGYVAASLSENVYGSYPPLTGPEAVNWWKNDKTDLRHNRNLLSEAYTDIGVGYSFFNNYGYYVIVFARP